ncbi:MAG: hypothetical protein J2O39_02385 [Acidimicrobiales bacterium]|nr:hypothetical protein [Acidimicrobiales bacterium]MBO0885966.1 hypothetical protein [Acidimicrobiales bacterium]MBO0893198.1 hypothetical protein [Acidimicrobiales bacterium]
MFERFTDRARRVLVLAQEEARLLNHNFIGTEHVLLGLLREGESIAADALRSLGVSLEAARSKVEQTIGPSGLGPGDSPPFTPRAKKVLELSLREALQLDHDYIGPEHLLLGLIREGEGVASQVLVSLGSDLSRARQRVLELLEAEPEEGPEEEPIRRPGGAVPPWSGRRPAGRPRRREEPAGEAPACPTCGAGLSGEAVWTTLSVPSTETSASPRPLTVVYCRACGTTLAVLPGEATP